MTIKLDTKDSRDYLSGPPGPFMGSATVQIIESYHVPPPYPALDAQTFEDEFGPPKRQVDPSCSVHGVLAVMEHEWYRLSDWSDKPILSAQFLYWVARQWMYPVGDGVQYQQVAVQSREVLKALKRYGVCPEAYWTEEIGKYAIQPPADRFTLALGWRPKIYGSPDPTMLKTLLQIHVAVACIVETYTSWNAADVWSPDGGITPAPRDTMYPPSSPDVGTSLGYHAVCLAGFDNLRGCWRIRNSNGLQWADHGYAWVPYEYELRDLWTITHMEEGR